MKTLPLLAVLLFVTMGTGYAQECEDQGDFKVCASGDTQTLEFSDSSWVGISSDRLVFYPLGFTYVFAKQNHPQESREGSLRCVFQPAFYYGKFQGVPDNWRMRSAYDYWLCLAAQDLNLENELIMFHRHKDLRTRLYNDQRYTERDFQYLHDHFGEARFDVYTLAQNEEAYRFARK